MKPPRVRRAGFALVEMVSLIVVVGMLLSLSAVVLNQAYRVHANTLSYLQYMQQLNFWVDRFRADAHEATGVATDDGLTFFGAEQSTIRYVLEDGVLVRRMWAGEQVLSEERWRAPQVATAGWHVEVSGRFSLVNLRLEFRPSPAQWEPIEWVARVGSDVSETRQPGSAPNSDEANSNAATEDAAVEGGGRAP